MFSFVYFHYHFIFLQTVLPFYFFADVRNFHYLSSNFCSVSEHKVVIFSVVYVHIIFYLIELCYFFLFYCFLCLEDNYIVNLRFSWPTSWMNLASFAFKALCCSLKSSCKSCHGNAPPHCWHPASCLRAVCVEGCLWTELSPPCAARPFKSVDALILDEWISNK